MKVNKYQDSHLAEEHIDVFYKEITGEIQGIFNYLSARQTLIGRNGELQTVINPNDIFYCEAVDKKIFAYLKSEVFQLELSLQNLTDTYSSYGFVRVSKSMVVNVYKVKQLKADLNMRVNLIMENGEIIIMNRTYKKDFYRFLREMEGAVHSNER